MRRLLALSLLALASVAHAGPNDPFKCPRGQDSLMSQGEFAAAIAPYQSGEIDPLPPGKKEKPLPVVNFVRADLEDDFFPSSGRANAVLLVRESGTVARVLVPCTSSLKLIDPIIASLSKARLEPATRGGKPVPSLLVVPVKFGD